MTNALSKWSPCVQGDGDFPILGHVILNDMHATVHDGGEKLRLTGRRAVTIGRRGAGMIRSLWKFDIGENRRVRTGPKHVARTLSAARCRGRGKRAHAIFRLEKHKNEFWINSARPPSRRRCRRRSSVPDDGGGGAAIVRTVAVRARSYMQHRQLQDRTANSHRIAESRATLYLTLLGVRRSQDEPWRSSIQTLL